MAQEQKERKIQEEKRKTSVKSERKRPISSRTKLETKYGKIFS